MANKLVIYVVFIVHVTAVTQVQLGTLDAAPPRAQNTLLMARLTTDVHMLHT